MKKFTLFFSALLFSMMSFAGVVTFDADADKGNAGTDSNKAAAYTITKGGVTVEVSKGILGTYQNEMHYRVYKSQTLTVTSTVGNITSVEFTCTAKDNANYGPANFVADSGDYASAGELGTWTGNAATVVFTADAAQVRATQVVVTIDGEGGSETPETPEEPETPVTPENPEGVITCAEAVAICEATGETSTTETYTIRGYVTEIKTAYSEQYGNISFWMADTPDGGKVLQGYRVKPVNDADINVAVGDYVEVVGTLVNFMSNTPEVNAGGTYTIITAGEGGETPEEPETPDVETVGDGTAENPYTVEDVLALNNTSKGPHYVKGFIIGQVNGASISSGLDTEAPFEGSTNSDGSIATQGTNLMIASVMGETTKIVAVQLPKGDLRTAFNLVENPDMLGKEVLICGNLEKYFGVPGIKSPTSIEVIGGDNGDVVNVTGLQYADAIYVEEDGSAYWEIQLYNRDVETEEMMLPIMAVGFEAKSKTALNGEYDLLRAVYINAFNEETLDPEGVWNDETIAATLTIKNVDNESNYSFVGTFVGVDGKTYKINTVANVYAMEDVTEEEIELKEEGTDEPGDDPVTPPSEGFITCAEAVAICEATGTTATTETYTIRGYVTEIKYAYSEQYGTATFWIADTKDGGNMLQAYSCAPLTDADKVFAVGAYVELVGKLKQYNTTNEVEKGTYTIITAGEGGETPETPAGFITCAEAVAICEATGTTATTETYTIRGYVTEIKYAYSEQYGTATFWIADTKDGGNMLQAYSCAPLTDADKVFAVGAYVELVGKLKQYNTTNEVEKGTYTIITAGEGGTTPDEPETPDVETVGDGTAENPYTVEDVLALNNTSKGPHYVKGFIIGQVNGASISTGLDTEAPFEGSTNNDGSVATQGTNLMIASAQGETTTIVPVALPKGDLRTAFNLVENPDMLGKEVLICGNLEKYFGVPGIKSPTSIEVINSTPTGVEDVVTVEVPVKVIKNGQMMIIRGENVYNVLGAQVK